jgi:hypothetical protein
VKLPSSKRRIAAAAVLVVLALFWLRPGASRLKSRIASSISSAVGRPVEIGSVHIRLLPRPGFDLENLVVYEDPAFGAEPMLRASEVTAALRLTSLLRGRLEVARLDLTDPSLNLVHRASGGWNLEALLERTARIPLAPTAKAKSEPRPGFPYIEATSARINFKSGPEKKPYALTNADFSLWQDSENSWGVRMKAQPFRTDLNLNDTGLVQVSGTWQRAKALRDTPLKFSVEWNRAQLGQLTKFFTGNDQGWRGEVQLDMTLEGTPAKMLITSDGSIQDFRRYDITSGQALRLAAHCDAEYSSTDHAIHGLQCAAPAGSGLIALKGDMGLPGSHSCRLKLAAENVPASALAILVERAKKNLPEDLVADGALSGSVAIEQDPATGSKLQVEGRGKIADLRLASAANQGEIGPETVPFLLTAGDSAGNAAPHKPANHGSAPGMRAPVGARVEFGPFPLAMGRVPATARGWINRDGYELGVAGEADIPQTLRVARMLGLAALQTSAEGTAQLDLHIVGSWAGRSQGTSSGFAGPRVTGTAGLRNVRVAVRGVGGAVEIVSADMELLPDQVRIGKLNAKAADTLWTGSLEMPRGCGTPGACEVHFNLNTKEIALGELSEWVSPGANERPWYRVLQSNGQAGPSFLGSLRASGQLSVDRLLMQSLKVQSLKEQNGNVQDLAATRVSAKVSVDSGKLRIAELNADVLGGKHRGEWLADFSVKPAVCGGRGSVTGISLTSLAEAMKNGWITGTANASYELKGPCPAKAGAFSLGSFTTSFMTGAEGTVDFEMRDGIWPRIVLGDDAEALKVTRLAGRGRLHAGTIDMKDLKLESPAGKFQVSGTAALQGELDLRLTRTQGVGYTISGTLAEPLVRPVAGAETQARLKR